MAKVTILLEYISIGFITIRSERNIHFNKIVTFVKKRMDTIYFLPSCDTCRKIIKMLPKGIELDFQDIRETPINEESLAKMYALSGSYEALFSKKAQLYKEKGLKDKNLTEADYKKYILEHYTFLSRPVFIIKNEIFIGNSQPNILKLMKYLGNV